MQLLITYPKAKAHKAIQKNPRLVFAASPHLFKKSFINLGCGGGRSLCFFNKQLRINYFGIEYNASIYADCKKLFQKHDNIQIFNDDFMSFKFLDFNNDCFFINDPLKKNMILTN